MDFYVDNKLIKINTKPIGMGSEGVVYKKGDTIYKIYFKEMLYEFNHKKETVHTFLTSLEANQINLPNNLIYDENGNYVGYSAKFINNYKNKLGFINYSRDILLNNLRVLENDIDMLHTNNIMVRDVSPVNFILDNDKMHIIDPGRYCFKFDPEYVNERQYESLIELLLLLNLKKYKIVSSTKKLNLIKDIIVESYKKRDMRYSEFFDEKLKDYNSIYEYAKSLEKYVR